VRLLRRARDLALGRARHIVCPSGFLAGRAVAWGVPAARVTVVPNAAPAPPVLGARDDLRRAHGLDGPTLVFAGRVTRQKSLEAGLEAVARTDGVTLLVVGDGPELEAARRRAAELGLDGRARFLGSRPRHEVLELLHAADGLLLPSSWENFPHAVVEALAVGSPVIATSVGGVAEVVSDGVNGLLVPPGDVAALAAAVERFFADAALRQRLAAAAAPSVERLQPEAIYERLERILVAAAG
jgi:2-deoxystreptamine N-acetyl-D-glucosaminyltransferase/2-deoxystreptamine glucosyltransferase